MIDLKCGDCLKLMKDISDKSIDMILCDLPYGTTQNRWDTVISLNDLWNQYKRIIKDDGAIVLFSQPPFDKILACSNLKMFRYEWIWQKENSTGFLNAKKMPLKIHENILVFYKKLPTYNPQMRLGFKPYKPYKRHNLSRHSTNYGDYKQGYPTESNGERYPIDIINFQREAGLHPTQKPVALLEYLIKTYTNQSEIVLDNCMGSGSTGVACVNTNRNFIGFELDENYFNIAKTRINNALEEKNKNI